MLDGGNYSHLDDGEDFSTTPPVKFDETPELSAPQVEVLTLRQRVRQYTVVEPYVFLALLGIAMKLQVGTSLYFDKACVVYENLTRSECGKLENTSAAFISSQKWAGDFTMIATIAGTIPSILAGIFIGAFCDRYGKKIPMMIAPLSGMIEMIGTGLCAYYFDSSLYWLVLCALLSGLTGGMMVIMTGTYSYISEVSSEGNRAMRFAILEMCFIVGLTSGMALGGLIYQLWGYIPVYVTAFVINLVAIFQLWICMKEKGRASKQMSYREIARELFSLHSVKESYHTAVRMRPGNARLQIWLLLLTMLFCVMPTIGTTSMSILYVKKRYGWEVETYAYISSAAKILSSLCTAVVIPLFTKILQINDCYIATIGLLSQMAEYLMRAFAVEKEYFIASFAVGAVGGCMSVALRNRVSKLLEPNEIGKVFLLIAIVEMNAPMLGIALFSQIYNATLTGFIGAAYLVASALFVIPLIIVLWIKIWGTLPASSP